MARLVGEVLRKLDLGVGLLEVAQQPEEQVRPMLLGIAVVGEDGDLGRNRRVDLGLDQVLLRHLSPPRRHATASGRMVPHPPRQNLVAAQGGRNGLAGAGAADATR